MFNETAPKMSCEISDKGITAIFWLTLNSFALALESLQFVYHEQNLYRLELSNLFLCLYDVLEIRMQDSSPCNMRHHSKLQKEVMQFLLKNTRFLRL